MIINNLVLAAGISALDIIIPVAAAVVTGILCFVGGIAFRKNVAEKEIGSAEEEAKRIINESIKNAENKKRESLLEVKEEIHSTARI